MTTPSRPSRVTSAGDVPLEKGSEAYVRALGRAFVLAICGALRNVRMYPADNPVVQRSLQELSALSSELLDDDGELEMRIAGEFLFINQTRLRLDLDNYATVNYLIAQFRASGTGLLRTSTVPTPADWTVLVTCINSPKGDDPVTRHHHLHHRLAAAGVNMFELEPPVRAEMGGSSERGAATSDPAKGAYAKSVAAASDVMHAVAIGQSPNLKVVKRTVQLIVDRILSDEASMLGLTTIRDYQDQTFTHAVNVCIFSVALGRRLGLSRVQLYDLGLAALFHDCGKSRMPEGILDKTGPLTDDDWKAITAHPWTGVLTLFHLREHNEYPYRAMMVSYEHHLKRDATGYPKRLRPRPVGFYSKIVAVIEAFDAATTRLGHNDSPTTPAGVVTMMRENAHKHLDPVVVLTFTDMLGVYPVGTVFMLDTFEMAISYSVNPNPDFGKRPLALVISDDEGNLHHPGVLVDLGETDEDGKFKRSILEIVDPVPYGIRVGDYFL
jgi:HD-GYP domain-containing protein (c-di-GMP phosphodiesterase class II)